MLKQLFYQKSINQINFLTIVFAALLTSIFTMVILITIYDDHVKEIRDLETDYFKSQKQSIVDETNRALHYIDFVYNKYKDTKSKEEILTDIVDTVEQMRNDREGSGYIFIYTFEGVNVADPILKENRGKNLLHVKDPNGKEVIKELIEVSKREDGGFVEYIWNKPTDNTPASKISYAKSYEPLGLMVGSGVYIDDLNKVIDEKKDIYSSKISTYTFEILGLTFLLFASGMVIYRFFTELIKKEIDRIRMNLKTAPIKCEGIDTNTPFKEFEEIIESVNEMIDAIKVNRKELEDLNKNLEVKVEEKTKKLQESKEYVENLLKKQDSFIKTSIHEINTPLSIIITNIELFIMKNGRNSYLTKIEAGSKIINNVFNDLSYIIKKDRLEYKNTRLNFSDFLYFRTQFFSEIAKGANTDFFINIEEEIFIDFNEVQLQRIIDNNLSNSIKYSKKGHPIEISLQKRQDKIHLVFKNRSETQIKESHKIFEEFYRESSSRGGFGLGLKIVKDICDENFVKITVESNKDYTLFHYTFKESI